jgi:hypothetical protein
MAVSLGLLVFVELSDDNFMNFLRSLDDKSLARDNEKNLLSPSHRHSVNTMNLSRSRSSIGSMSAMSHQSSYDNEDLDSLDAISI